MTVVVGVVGPIASGKDVLSELVADGLNAKRFSFSTVIDEELARKGKEITRQNQRELANALRKLEGPGMLAKQLVEKISSLKGFAVVEGFRNPFEVKEFYFTFGKKFLLIAIDAKLSVRFKRAMERAKQGEKKTLEEFKELDARERGKGEELFGHNLDACMDMADYAVINNDDLNNLRRQAKLVVEKAKKL